MKKILSIMLIVIMIFAFSNSVFASQAEREQTIQKNQALASASSSGSTTKNKVGEMADVIIGVIQVIGVAVAIIMLIMLGIKYVSAAPSEKADIKKSAVIYVVGAVLLFGASLVLSLVKNLISDFGGDDQVGGVMDMVNQ